MENTGSPNELQPAAHRSPEMAGRRSPSKHSLAGQGRHAHDLPRVEMLNLGSWTLQGACKSTVAQRTKEGVSGKCLCGLQRISEGPEAKKGRPHHPRGLGPNPWSRAWCQRPVLRSSVPSTARWGAREQTRPVLGKCRGHSIRPRAALPLPHKQGSHWTTVGPSTRRPGQRSDGGVSRQPR